MTAKDIATLYNMITSKKSELESLENSLKDDWRFAVKSAAEKNDEVKNYVRRDVYICSSTVRYGLVKMEYSLNDLDESLTKCEDKLAAIDAFLEKEWN